MHASVSAQPPGSSSFTDLDTIEPGSALYQALGDPVMFSYGLAPVLVNSVLIPKSARGVEEHERLVNGSIPNPGVEHIIGRLADTIDLLFGAVFAASESKQAAEALHELHRTVTGNMPDGSIYHAWNKDTWMNTWFVQVKAFMEVYGILRGFDDEAHRFAVYRGFVKLGRQFRVSNVPESLAESDAYWERLVESTLTDSDSARFLLAQTTQQLLKPTTMRWIPTPI